MITALPAPLRALVQGMLPPKRILPAALLLLPALLHAAGPVATAAVAWRQVEATWASEAIIEAERQSTVAAQTAGRVTAIYFRPGDTVKQGQLIMRIDPSVAEQQVAGMKAQVEEARVGLENATREYNRFRELFAAIGLVLNVHMRRYN